MKKQCNLFYFLISLIFIYAFTVQAHAGSITFGSYPQTESGGYKPVEWLVLETYDDGSILAISQYALSAQMYGIDIITTDKEDSNYSYSMRLLRRDEITAYSLSTCKPTAYAKLNGVRVDDNGNCMWWAERAPEDSWANSYFYAVVWEDGSNGLWAPGSLGESDMKRVGYRPAILLKPNLSMDIRLNAMGGTVSPSSVTVQKGYPYGTLPTPVRDGYSFDGWYTDTNYSNPVFPDSIATQPCTLHAKWEEIPQNVTIMFNPMSGTVFPTSKNYTKGTTYGTLPTPERKGYIFKGWYTDSKYQTQITAASKAAKTCTLYAKWTPIEYTVVFNPNGGKGSMTSLTCKYDRTYTLPDCTATKSGYSFKEWKGSNGNNYKNKATIKNLCDKNNKKITLSAQWGLKVTFDAMKGKVSPKYIVIKKGDIYGTLPVPVREGYLFKGWYTEKEYRNKISPTSSRVKKAQTLFAKWKPVKYTIAFAKNDGTGTMESITCTYDKTISLPVCRFKKKNASFTGWKCSNGVTYKDEASVKNLTTKNGETIILTAQWGSELERIIENLKKDTTLVSNSKRNVYIEVVKHMWEKGYTAEFIAGMLGNIYREGNFGVFENLNYSSGSKYYNRAYIKDIREYHNDYLKNYSHRYVYGGKSYNPVSISNLQKFVKQMPTKHTDGTTCKGKFGLGCVQWTGSRTKSLLTYYKNYAGQKDYLTKTQAMQAECAMILYEFNHESHGIKTINLWKSTSNKTAYYAGYIICYYYEAPLDRANEAVIRGNAAEKFYKIMMK